MPTAVIRASAAGGFFKAVFHIAAWIGSKSGKHGDFGFRYPNRFEGELSRVGLRRNRIDQGSGPNREIVHAAVKVSARRATPEITRDAIHVLDIVRERLITAPLDAVYMKHDRIGVGHHRNRFPLTGRKGFRGSNHLRITVDGDPKGEFALVVARGEPADVTVGIRELKDALALRAAVPFDIHHIRDIIRRHGHAGVQIDELILAIQFQHRSIVVGRVRSAINQPGPGDTVSIPDAIAILLFKLIFQKKAGEVFIEFTLILPIAPAPQPPVPFVPVAVLDVVAVNDRVAMHRTADFGVPFADTKIVDHGTQDVGVFKDPCVAGNNCAISDDRIIPNLRIVFDHRA